jgi:putative transposase
VSIEFKGSHFERDVILWGVRWYVAYPISYRQLEEMMEERGVEGDHSTLSRWVLKYAPLLEKEFRAHKRPVGRSWRMDETYIRIKGVWKYLYRAVDKAGATVDFLLTAKPSFLLSNTINPLERLDSCRDDRPKRSHVIINL